ncbi:MAG TPA: urea ABC transporter ATP-binding subunit UrtE, partial [Beijerinckiaceae bacterium]|nr:urea ABC transporter ATP-binding subunit UrtE [Beijerinckiaceae bacterium]
MLTVDNVSLYYGAAQALRGVSLEARPGEVTCVLGRNGVGKTSLLRAVVGQRPISRGSILFEGREILDLKPYQRAGLGIAYVPQGREIFPLLTVKENLETGYAPLPRAQRSIPGEVFELFPVLKSMLGRRGGDLSGGQQQQLAIGRALITRPKVLLLDEPTEGIQPSIIKDIEAAIRSLSATGEMAILVVEQYYDFARSLADQYLVMERGEIVARGAGADMDK